MTLPHWKIECGIHVEKKINRIKEHLCSTICTCVPLSCWRQQSGQYVFQVIGVEVEKSLLLHANENVSATDHDVCPRQGGAFSANGARIALHAAHLSSFNTSSNFGAVTTPRVTSLGLLHRGCPVQPPIATSFFSASKPGEASVVYDSTPVKADGYFFCVDLSDQSSSGSDWSEEVAYPRLQWTFDISAGVRPLDKESNTTPSNTRVSPGAGGKNLSNSSDVQKWTPIGSSVWTRRYRFLHSVQSRIFTPQLSAC